MIRIIIYKFNDSYVYGIFSLVDIICRQLIGFFLLNDHLTRASRSPKQAKSNESCNIVNYIVFLWHLDIRNIVSSYLSEKLNPLVLLIRLLGRAVGGADFREISFVQNEVSSESMFSELIFIGSLEPQSDEIFLPDVFNPIAEEWAELTELWLVKLPNADLLLISG